MHIRSLLSSIILTLSTVASSSIAATLTVGATQQYVTIQAAINASVNGDTILVSSGVYNERISMNGKSLQILSVSGPQVTSINANGLTGSAVTYEATVPAAARIEGFTIQGATTSAMTITSCSPLIRNCWFIGNSTSGTDGAAVQYLGSGGSVRFESCRFVSNRANVRRGGAMSLAATGGSTTCVDCLFRLNEATSDWGGAIYQGTGSLALVGCEFDSNVVQGNGGDRRGGAVYINSGTLTISDCDFISNLVFAQATGGCGDRVARGGAIAGSGAISIANSDFRSNVVRANGSCNTAIGWGGAAWITAGSLAISDCLFESNVAEAHHGSAGRDSRGGAIHAEGGVDPVLLRCTFVGNTATGTDAAGMTQLGGSLCYMNGSAGTVTDCTFSASIASSGGAVFLDTNAEPVFAGCHFADCSAGGAGGAVHLSPSAESSFDDCRFSNCESPQGGALFSNVAAPIVKTCVFDHNASASGSAIKTVGTGIGFVPSVQFSTFCSNQGATEAQWIVGQIYEPFAESNSAVADCGPDCNSNGVLDSLEIANGAATDCDVNGQPDSCQPDCDGDGSINACEILAGAPDCDADGVPDACQLAKGAADVNLDGILDSCVPVDFVGLRTEIVPIVDRSADTTIPPQAICYRIYAEFTNPASRVLGIFGNAPQSGPNGPFVVAATGGFYNTLDLGDTTNVIPCNTASYGAGAVYDSWFTIEKSCLGGSALQNPAGFDFTNFSVSGINDTDCILLVNPDSSQGTAGPAGRVLLAQLTTVNGDLPTGQFNIVGRNGDGTDLVAYAQRWAPPTLVDCNGNGVHDAYDIRDGSALDCDESGVPDSCEYALPNEDCNGNGTPDLCDINTGASADINRNNVPDECECAGDVDGDGTVNVDDIVEVILSWGETGSNPADLNGDFVVDMQDLVLVLNYYGQCA